MNPRWDVQQRIQQRRMPEVGIATLAIVIPCTDQACLVQDAVEAALSLDGVDVRVVVVDDASSDSTCLVRRTFQGRDRVGWIRTHAPQGPVVARNLGLTYCQTDAVGFLDPASVCRKRLQAVGCDVRDWWASEARDVWGIKGSWVPMPVFERLGGYRDRPDFERDLRVRRERASRGDHQVSPFATCSHTVWGPLWMQPNPRLPQVGLALV